MKIVSYVAIVAVIAVAMLGVGCTDAQMSSFGAYGEKSDIQCWSGGQIVFFDTSTGKVQPLDGEGLTYRSNKTGKYVRIFADCLVTNK